MAHSTKFHLATYTVRGHITHHAKSTGQCPGGTVGQWDSGTAGQRDTGQRQSHAVPLLMRLPGLSQAATSPQDPVNVQSPGDARGTADDIAPRRWLPGLCEALPQKHPLPMEHRQGWGAK